MVDKYTQSNWVRRVSLWFFFISIYEWKQNETFSRQLFHLAAKSGIFNSRHSSCLQFILQIWFVIIIRNFTFYFGRSAFTHCAICFGAVFDKDFNCLSSFQIHCHYKSGVIIAYGRHIECTKSNEWMEKMNENRNRMRKRVEARI